MKIPIILLLLRQIIAATAIKYGVLEASSLPNVRLRNGRNTVIFCFKYEETSGFLRNTRPTFAFTSVRRATKCVFLRCRHCTQHVEVSYERHPGWDRPRLIPAMRGGSTRDNGFKLKQGSLRLDMRRHFFTGWTAKQQSGLPESVHCYSLKFFRPWLDQSLTDPISDPLEREVGMETSEVGSNLIIIGTCKATSVKFNSCSINIWQLY